MQRAALPPIPSQDGNKPNSDGHAHPTDATEALIASSIKTRLESQRLCLQARALVAQMGTMYDDLRLKRRASANGRFHRPPD